MLGARRVGYLKSWTLRSLFVYAGKTIMNCGGREAMQAHEWVMYEEEHPGSKLVRCPCCGQIAEKDKIRGRGPSASDSV